MAELNSLLNIKIFGWIIFVFNVTVGITNFLYLIIQSSASFGIVVGIFIIGNLSFTMLYSLILSHHLRTTMKRGRRLNLLCYGYFGGVILAMLFTFLAVFIGFNDTVSVNLGLGVLLYGANFGIVIYGAVLGLIPALSKNHIVLSTSSIPEDLVWERSIKTQKRMRWLKGVIIIICILEIVIGGLVCYSLFFGLQGRLRLFMIRVFAGQTALLIGIATLSFTFILLKITRTISGKLKRIPMSFFVILGIVLTGLCFVPLGLTPQFVQDADEAFSASFNPVFSGDWKAVIDNSGYVDAFLQTPFSVGGYFLGSPTYDCIVRKDVLYLDGSLSNFTVDANVKLYFDAYIPPNDSDSLPGNRSTLIRLHGGGLTIGDKGLGNVLTMNRYFAAQGYCVFDIQYGLNNGPESMDIPIITPPNVLGNFTLDDMMRHIGVFTFYLEDHNTEYGANLDSVFISGGSSGGQLACATALSIASGNYTEMFSANYSIKGIIPYYPANNVSMSFAQQSTPEWRNPELLVNNQSPPCLIYQGDQDHLIFRSRSLENTYLNRDNAEVCLLIFPLAGHASDLYFSGYYNQVFLYYMERFMFLYH
ncbi:MAG: alpha/beta hydrolase [Asgard group archaeon]|nr:alpha/beta hydrolase [Asgard group archaeon]